MQISFNTNASNVNSTITKHERNVKKNATTDINKNISSKVNNSQQTQIEVENTTQTQQKTETTFPTFHTLSRMVKYLKVLDEHYSKINKENKKFPNPENHIEDKYFNKKSPYYVKGLTQLEREICFGSEWHVLNGMPPALNSYDPVIQEKFGGCNIFVEEMEWNQDVRDDMNNAINKAFEENGILIPEDVDLQLIVDPYKFYINASGVDKELAKRIEDALNKGENGYYLYSHISYCNPVNYGVDVPLQFNQGDGGKTEIFHLVNRLTGYDISELENRDGKFHTPDGEDLWKVLTDKYNEMVADGTLGSFGLGNYYEQYRRLAKEGWNMYTDSNLTIGYKNSSLYDIDTTYGYGQEQKEWQVRVRNWYDGIQKQYRKERDETLRREENTPTKLEMSIESTKQKTDELNRNRTVFSNGKFELVAPNISEFQKVFNGLIEDGLLRLIPITSEILSLSAEPKATQIFDCKA